MRQDIAKHSISLLETSPVVQRMKRRPEYQDWARKLVSYADYPNLHALRHVLSAIAQDALTHGIVFTTKDLQSIPASCCRAAAETALRAAADEVGPALILAFVANLSWSQLRSARSEKQQIEDWALIPYACAATGVKAQAYHAALTMVELVYDAVHSLTAPTVYGHPLLQKYRGLARTAIEAYEVCIQNFADDLRESCTSGPDSFRAEFCAMLWTLGFVSYSYAFQHIDALPSRQLCRQVVRRSIETLHLDQLMQFIWLSMRDRGPFDIRKHEALYGNINRRFPPHRSDALVASVIFEDPNAIFATTLTRWFRGDLTAEDLQDFTTVCEWFVNLDQNLDDRVTYLFYLLSTTGSFTPCSDHTGWVAEVEAHTRAIIARKRNWALLHPATMPPLFAASAPGIQDLIETRLAKACDDHDEQVAMDGFRFLEEFRQALQLYWNITVPMTPDMLERSALEPLLAEEEQLLNNLRGAYFMLLTPKLPIHYRRFTADYDTKERVQYMTADYGREQMQRILNELHTLHQRMQDVAPRYARMRAESVAWEDVVTAIGLPEMC